jgi:hypothetical protein
MEKFKNARFALWEKLRFYVFFTQAPYTLHNGRLSSEPVSNMRLEPARQYERHHSSLKEKLLDETDWKLEENFIEDEKVRVVRAFHHAFHCAAFCGGST